MGGFFQIQLACFVFWVNRNFSFESLEILEGFKYTANTIRYLDILIHLIPIKLLHLGVTLL